MRSLGDPTDTDLARALLGPGLGRAIAFIQRRHGETIRLVAIHWYRLDAQDAEEILNDTLLTASRDAATYDPARGTLRAWIVGIACNRARRKIEAIRARERPLADGQRHGQIEGLGPHDLCVLEETRALIDSARARMTPLQSDILGALIEQGPETLTDRMLADRHRTTPQTVKVERWRLRRRLARLLAPVLRGGR
jgi:RNA polymerase sigma-70 factor (ECF subfamily)